MKISGGNVSPVEVQSILRTLPGAKASRVVGLPLADQDLVLVAAKIPEDGANIMPEELRAQLKAPLSSYKVPRHYVILTEEELPMTASAEIYKPPLREFLLQRINA